MRLNILLNQSALFTPKSQNKALNPPLFLGGAGVLKHHFFCEASAERTLKKGGVFIRRHNYIKGVAIAAIA